jgi:hypothetical protein
MGRDMSDDLRKLDPPASAYRVSSVERPSLMWCGTCGMLLDRVVDHDYGVFWEGKVLRCSQGHGSIVIWPYQDSFWHRRWQSFRFRGADLIRWGWWRLLVRLREKLRALLRNGAGS